MWFWLFMFYCNLLIPCTMIVFGWIMREHPPKDINSSFGYRTRMSMLNEDTWKFAHKTCGTLWRKTGWITLFPSALVQFPFLHSSDDTIGTVGLILCLLQCAVLIGSILPVERALKRTFHPDGTRK